MKYIILAAIILITNSAFCENIKFMPTLSINFLNKDEGIYLSITGDKSPSEKCLNQNRGFEAKDGQIINLGGHCKKAYNHIYVSNWDGDKYISFEIKV